MSKMIFCNEGVNFVLQNISLVENTTEKQQVKMFVKQ